VSGALRSLGGKKGRRLRKVWEQARTLEGMPDQARGMQDATGNSREKSSRCTALRQTGATMLKEADAALDQDMYKTARDGDHFIAS
jgi:hypothetical protein